MQRETWLFFPAYWSQNVLRWKLYLNSLHFRSASGKAEVPPRRQRAADWAYPPAWEQPELRGWRCWAAGPARRAQRLRGGSGGWWVGGQAGRLQLPPRKVNAGWPPRQPVNSRVALLGKLRRRLPGRNMLDGGGERAAQNGSSPGPARDDPVPRRWRRAASRRLLPEPSCQRQHRGFCETWL